MQEILVIDRKYYILKIAKMKAGANFELLRARLVWASNWRLYICCAIVLLHQGTDELFQKKRLPYKKDRPCNQHLQRHKDGVVNVFRLDKCRLKTKLDLAAIFSSNHDSKFQLGYFIFLTNNSKMCQPLSSTSYEARRLNYYVCESKLMALRMFLTFYLQLSAVFRML